MTSATINDAVTMRPGGGAVLGSIDKYELVRELGEGGFGTVYLAHDTVAKTYVAIKGLPPEVKHNPAELESIRGNFALVSRLRHPGIAAVRDLHLAQNVKYLSKDAEAKLRVFPRDTMVVMDYVPGVTLAQWRRQFPDCRVPVDTALEIARQIAFALDYAHGQKVLHRDVKPANIMVDTADDGGLTVRVLDFGLAAEIRSSMGRVSREIRDTSGTRPYMAPEQWLGKRQGPATDQYSLAILFYEVVVGEVPFASVFGCGDTAVMRIAVTADAPEIPSSLPKNVRRALAVALAKKPEERFASCGDFVSALEGKTVRGGSNARNGGMGKVLAFAALLAALAGGAWWWMKEETKGTGRTDETDSPPVASVPEPKSVTKPAASDSRRQKEDAERMAQERAAEFVRLKTRINIKVSDAREKLRCIDAFRTDPDGLALHIKSADGQKKILAAIETPKTIDEAKAAFDIVERAEAQISLDLEWLMKNKAGRDAAKSAAAEIDSLMSGDIAKFKAERYASQQFEDGKLLVKNGVCAFDNGDFNEAVRLLRGAKASFADAAAKARAYCVGTMLESAQKCANDGEWRTCIERCDKVLAWDSGNAKAKELMMAARMHLGPSLMLVATINGHNIDGAKVRVGDKDYITPVRWECLSVNARIGPCRVTYESGGKRYHGELAAVIADWSGPRVLSVALTEFTPPKNGDTKAVDLPGGVKMEMIYCAPGEYVYGDAITPMRMDHGFWLGKYEVTQKQWKSVMDGSEPSHWKGGNLPVENVSWNDCQAFVNKVDAEIRRQLGGSARLPTEHEWEYACRAGSRTKYSWGDVLDGSQANCDGTHPEGTSAKGLYKGKTTPVGAYETKGVNNWGFCDMHGNVWEWCEDAYDASGARRILRGGGWGSRAQGCRSASRDWNAPVYCGNYGGFRLCCSEMPPQ